MEYSTVEFLRAIKSGLSNLGKEIDDPMIKAQIKALDEAITAVEVAKEVKEFRVEMLEVANELARYEYAGSYTDGKMAAYGYVVGRLDEILGRGGVHDKSNDSSNDSRSGKGS